MAWTPSTFRANSAGARMPRLNMQGQPIDSRGMTESQYLQNQLIQAEIDRVKKQGQLTRQQGEAASKMSAQFLDQWNKGLQNLTGMYNVATEQIAKSYGYLDDAKAAASGMDDVIAQVNNDWSQYRDTFDPLQGESIDTAREGLMTERELMGTIRDLNRADYEGVAGSAKADVAAESERGRQAQQREMQGLGVDPTSGNYQNSMRRSRANEAINKVLAGNMARLNEKNRLTGVATTGLSVIDPSRAYGIAGDISRGSREYAGMVSGLEGTKVNAMTGIANSAAQLANAQTGVANSYGGNVTRPASEMYASTMGTALASSPGSLNQNSYNLNVPTAPAQASGVQSIQPQPAARSVSPNANFSYIGAL